MSPLYNLSFTIIYQERPICTFTGLDGLRAPNNLVLVFYSVHRAKFKVSSFEATFRI